MDLAWQTHGRLSPLASLLVAHWAALWKPPGVREVQYCRAWVFDVCVCVSARVRVRANVVWRVFVCACVCVRVSRMMAINALALAFRRHCAPACPLGKCVCVLVLLARTWHRTPVRPRRGDVFACAPRRSLRPTARSGSYLVSMYQIAWNAFSITQALEVLPLWMMKRVRVCVCVCVCVRVHMRARM